MADTDQSQATTGEKDGNERLPPTLNWKKKILNSGRKSLRNTLGIIMTRSFTCTISVVKHDPAEINSLLFAALGANIARGLTNAIGYLLMNLAERGHARAS